jgi:hypothetical protein
MPFFIILLKGFRFPLSLFDFWWHLKMGQVISETLAIPEVDLFSFTAAGKPFIVQNWLAEVLLYHTYRIGGHALLVFANAALLALTLLPVFILCRKSAGEFGVGIFSVGMVAACIPCNIRPQVFSSLLFSVFFCILVMHGSSRHSGKHTRLYILPVLTVLWVNLHGGFVVGLALLLIFFICEGARLLFSGSRRSFDGHLFRTLGMVLLLCLLATFANPQHYKIYDYVRTVVDDPSSRQLVMEWQPPSVKTVQGIVLFYLPFFLLTFAFICSRQRPSLDELMLYLGFSAFGMMAIRNSAWFLIVAAPMLARHLSAIDWRVFRSSGKAVAEIRRATDFHKRQRPLLNLVIALAIIVLLYAHSPWSQQRMNPNALLETGTPVGAMDFIDQNALKGRIFHPQGYGDYLIWRLWPRQHSFFDGRVHLFGESFVRYYQRIFEDSAWEHLLEGYSIRYLLLPKSANNPGEKKLLEGARSSNRWKLLYEDEVSVLFEKISRRGS